LSFGFNEIISSYKGIAAIFPSTSSTNVAYSTSKVKNGRLSRNPHGIMSFPILNSLGNNARPVAIECSSICRAPLAEDTATSCRASQTAPEKNNGLFFSDVVINSTLKAQIFLQQAPFHHRS